MPDAAPAFASPGGNNTTVPGFGKRRYEIAPGSEPGAIECEFVDVLGVPLVDEHEDVSEAELQEIVDNSNRRIADTGDASPIIFGEGHTSDFEGSDRPVKGFADNFRLGVLGKLDPRPCVIADLHIRAEFFDESKQYPRRSVELWKDPAEGCWVDSVALLGGTTPKRALGMAFSKGGISGKSGVQRPKRYELVEEPETMATEIAKDEQDKFNKMLEASAIGKYLLKQMEADEAASEGEEDKADETTGDVDKKAADCDEDKMAKGSKLSKAERLKLERDDARTELVRYQKTVEAQQTQITELARKFRKQERQGELERLRFDGYSFDLAEELDYCLDMDDAAYTKHVAKIQSRYAKAPLNYAAIPTVSMTEAKGGATAEQHKERAQRAVKYAMAKNCSFEEALAAISKG